MANTACASKGMYSPVLTILQIGLRVACRQDRVFTLLVQTPVAVRQEHCVIVTTDQFDGPHEVLDVVMEKHHYFGMKQTRFYRVRLDLS